MQSIVYMTLWLPLLFPFWYTQTTRTTASFALLFTKPRRLFLTKTDKVNRVKRSIVSHSSYLSAQSVSVKSIKYKPHSYSMLPPPGLLHETSVHVCTDREVWQFCRKGLWVLKVESRLIIKQENLNLPWFLSQNQKLLQTSCAASINVCVAAGTSPAILGNGYVEHVDDSETVGESDKTKASRQVDYEEGMFQMACRMNEI